MPYSHSLWKRATLTFFSVSPFLSHSKSHMVWNNIEVILGDICQEICAGKNGGLPAELYC